MTRQAVTQIPQQTLAITPVSTNMLQRACACGNHTMAGGECEECKKNRVLEEQASPQQMKLAISQPDDPYEQEADRVAEQVMRMPSGGVPRVSRRPLQIQRKETQGSKNTGVPASVNDVIGSSGQPLDAKTRAFMEPRFGRDFSGVRVHTDTQAVESARAMNAVAYTAGSNIVFDANQYKPSTFSGKQLLAHELTHTVQQSGVLSSLNIIQRREVCDENEGDCNRVDEYEYSLDESLNDVEYSDTFEMANENERQVSDIGASSEQEVIEFANDEIETDSQNIDEIEYQQAGARSAGCDEQVNWQPKSPVPVPVNADTIEDFINNYEAALSGNAHLDGYEKHDLEINNGKVTKVNMTLVTAIVRPSLGLSRAKGKHKELIQKAVTLIAEHETRHQNIRRDFAQKAVCDALGKSATQADSIIENYMCKREPMAQADLDKNEGGLRVIKDEKGQPIDVALVPLPNRPNYKC